MLYAFVPQRRVCPQASQQGSKKVGRTWVIGGIFELFRKPKLEALYSRISVLLQNKSLMLMPAPGWCLLPDTGVS